MSFDSSDWEQQPINSLANESIGGGTPKTNIEEYWNGSIPWIQSSDLKKDILFRIFPNKHISNTAITDSAAKIIPAGSIAIVTRVGVGKLALIKNTYATSQDFLSLVDLNNNPIFSVYLLYNFFKKEIKKVQGTSIKGITKNYLLSKKVNISMNETEQNKIGQTILKIDNAITLYQKQLSLYRSIEKSLLQKLFSKDGEKVPEVRFADFHDDWKQYKLGDITTEMTERASDFQLLSVTINSGVQRADTLNRKDSSSQNKSNYKKVCIGDIAYNSMRMWQGASGVSSYNGIVSPAYTVIRVKENLVDSKFLGYILKLSNMTWLFRTHSQGLTSDTWNLKYPLFSEISISIPSLREQKKIVELLEYVDKSITIQKNKIDELNKVKKMLLQKLFI